MSASSAIALAFTGNGDCLFPDLYPDPDDRHRTYEEGQRFYRTKAWKECSRAFRRTQAAVCVACKRFEYEVALHVDHIKPLRKHWSLRFDWRNHQMLCCDCNRRKGNRTGPGITERVGVETLVMLLKRGIPLPGSRDRRRIEGQLSLPAPVGVAPIHLDPTNVAVAVHHPAPVRLILKMLRRNLNRSQPA